MGLIDDLGAGRTGVDTAVFIYFIEEDPRYLPVIEPLFEQVDAGHREIVTSTLTLLEVLVVPYRAGDDALAQRYEQLLNRSRGVRMIDLSQPLLRDAARLRAKAAIKAPDALQLAAARSARCTSFVTNDRRIPDVDGLRVLQLSTYAAHYHST